MSYCAYHNSAASDPLSEEDHRWLFQKIRKVSAKWRDVGEALEFSHDQLKAITNEMSLKTDEHYMQELLSRWLKRAPPKHLLPCVEDLATALRSVEEERTAYDMKMNLESKGYVLHVSSNRSSSVSWCIISV